MPSAMTRLEVDTVGAEWILGEDVLGQVGRQVRIGHAEVVGLNFWTGTDAAQVGGGAGPHVLKDWVVQLTQLFAAVFQ